MTFLRLLYLFIHETKNLKIVGQKNSFRIDFGPSNSLSEQIISVDVQIQGYVTELKVKRTHLELQISDGTGTYWCFVWLSTAEECNFMSRIPNDVIGNYFSVTGRFGVFDGVQRLYVKTITHLNDSLSEFIWWSLVMKQRERFDKNTTCSIPMNSLLNNKLRTYLFSILDDSFTKLTLGIISQKIHSIPELKEDKNASKGCVLCEKVSTLLSTELSNGCIGLQFPLHIFDKHIEPWMDQNGVLQTRKSSAEVFGVLLPFISEIVSKVCPLVRRRNKQKYNQNQYTHQPEFTETYPSGSLNTPIKAKSDSNSPHSNQVTTTSVVSSAKPSSIKRLSLVSCVSSADLECNRELIGTGIGSNLMSPNSKFDAMMIDSSLSSSSKVSVIDIDSSSSSSASESSGEKSSSNFSEINPDSNIDLPGDFYLMSLIKVIPTESHEDFNPAWWSDASLSHSANKSSEEGDHELKSLNSNSKLNNLVNDNLSGQKYCITNELTTWLHLFRKGYQILESRENEAKKQDTEIDIYTDDASVIVPLSDYFQSNETKNSKSSEIIINHKNQIINYEEDFLNHSASAEDKIRSCLTAFMTNNGVLWRGGREHWLTVQHQRDFMDFQAVESYETCS